MSASTRPFSRWRVRNAYTGQRCSWVRRPAVIVLPSWGARARRNSEFGQGRRVAARVRIHGGTPGIQRPLGRVPDRADSQASEPGGELGHQRHRECRIGHGVPVVALGAITEPFPWRVRAGGLAAPRIRHCAGRHRVPGAKPGPPMASGILNPVMAGASWLVCASQGSPVLGTGGAWPGMGMGFLTGNESLRRRRAACYMGRGFGGAALPVPWPGAFTVLDPGKLRLLPGRLPRWPNPWIGPFSGAGTLRARGRARRREVSR